MAGQTQMTDRTSTAAERAIFKKVNAGKLTLDEANFELGRLLGPKFPDGRLYKEKSGVFRRGVRLGVLVPRHVSHNEIIVWDVRTEDNGHPYRRWLGAVARIRMGKPSPKDRFLVNTMQEALGDKLVIDYQRDAEPGERWRLLPRKPTDRDVIRAPDKWDRLRGSLRTKIVEGSAQDVAELAHRIGLSRAVLHRAGRADAADRLEMIQGAPVAGHGDADDPDADTASPRRLRAT